MNQNAITGLSRVKPFSFTSSLKKLADLLGLRVRLGSVKFTWHKKTNPTLLSKTQATLNFKAHLKPYIKTHTQSELYILYVHCSQQFTQNVLL